MDRGHRLSDCLRIVPCATVRTVIRPVRSNTAADLTASGTHLQRHRLGGVPLFVIDDQHATCNACERHSVAAQTG